MSIPQKSSLDASQLWLLVLAGGVIMGLALGVRHVQGLFLLPVTMDRGWSREDAESRIAAQATREERLAIATHVVENTGTLEELRAGVAEVYAELGGRER